MTHWVFVDDKGEFSYYDSPDQFRSEQFLQDEDGNDATNYMSKLQGDVYLVDISNEDGYKLQGLLWRSEKVEG